MRGEGRGEVGQQLKKMRTGSYAKITIAQVFSSTAISFLFQLKKKIANALRIKRERQKGKQLFSSLQGKKYSAEKRRPNRSQKCNHLR